MPVTPYDKLKNLFWKLIKPIWPFCARALRFVGIRPYGRHQPYLMGTLLPHKTPEDFKKYLEDINFVVDPLAWIDDDEVFGLRLLDNFRYQTHIRLYSNGEVHAHHEITPEYDDWGHLTDIDTSKPKIDFTKLLEGWVVPIKTEESTQAQES